MRTALVLAALTTLAYGQARVAIAPAPPPGTRSIWVLSADNKLVRYETSQWRQVTSMPVSREFRKRPESLAISATGQAFFTQEQEAEEGLRHFSFVDPGARTLMGGAFERTPAKDGGYLVTSAKPSLAFSGDGNQLYWFEHREQRLSQEGDRWRDAKFHAWTTDLSGENPKAIAEFSFTRCTCDTGACSETCPEALPWWPQRGVSDFFFVTRWVQGQTDTTFESTTLYQSKNGTWTSRKLATPVEEFLDAAEHGDTFIASQHDPGCCGWANEGDDTMYIVRGGVTTVRFDERKRFRNDNYDVSFYTPVALLSPDVSKLAYTITHSMQPGEEIRLNTDGKTNAEELVRVKKSISEMPMMEVIGVSGSAVLLSVPHAELVGWLDNSRLLIVSAGEVKVVEINTGRQTSTGIKADGAKYVFMR